MTGIPGNTVLEAMAQQLEKTCPLPMQSPPEVSGAGEQGLEARLGIRFWQFQAEREGGWEGGALQRCHAMAMLGVRGGCEPWFNSPQLLQTKV